MLDAGYEDGPRSANPFSQHNAMASQQSLMQNYSNSSSANIVVSAPRPLAGPNVPRFALNDDAPSPPASGSRALPPLAPSMRQYPSARSPLEGSTVSLSYMPVAPSTPSSADSHSSATGFDSRPDGGNGGHVKKRSLGGGKDKKEAYGPGGPLMSGGGGGGPPPLMAPPKEHRQQAGL